MHNEVRNAQAVAMMHNGVAYVPSCHAGRCFSASCSSATLAQTEACAQRSSRHHESPRHACHNAGALAKWVVVPIASSKSQIRTAGSSAHCGTVASPLLRWPRKARCAAVKTLCRQAQEQALALQWCVRHACMPVWAPTTCGARRSASIRATRHGKTARMSTGIGRDCAVLSACGDM